MPVIPLSLVRQVARHNTALFAAYVPGLGAVIRHKSECLFGDRVLSWQVVTRDDPDFECPRSGQRVLIKEK